MDKKELARALRRGGMTVPAIAKALGVSQSTVWRWLREGGERPAQSQGGASARPREECLERLDRVEKMLAEALERLRRLEGGGAAVKTGDEAPPAVAENAWVKVLRSRA